MEEEDKIVAIKVKWKTREKLKRWGSKGDTYDEVIQHMFVGLVGDQEEPQ